MRSEESRGQEGQRGLTKSPALCKSLCKLLSAVMCEGVLRVKTLSKTCQDEAAGGSDGISWPRAPHAFEGGLPPNRPMCHQ